MGNGKDNPALAVEETEAEAEAAGAEDDKEKVQAEAEDDEKAEEEEDTAIVELVMELKQEGTSLFRRRDYDRAAFKFDEAIKMSPRVRDVEIASLHSNVAACYMHMDRHEYLHQAIDRCNMALEASPRYTKALLKRARCFEALDRLDLACGDVQEVLNLEPNNVVAVELLDNIRDEMEEKKFLLEQEARSLDELIKGMRISATGVDRQQMNGDNMQDRESHAGAEEHASYANGGQQQHKHAVVDHSDKEDEEGEEVHQEHGDVGCGAKKCVEFVLGDDIRIALISPEDCSVVQLMDIARDKFPDLKEPFINFKDDRGNLVTVNSTTELTQLEGADSQSQRPLRLYVTEENHERVCCSDVPIRENE